jgi:hypothetical protein
MIQRYKVTGRLQPRKNPLNGFDTMYKSEITEFFAQIDQRHNLPNDFMVKKLCERAHEKLGEQNYKRLPRVSISHIYNFRCSAAYKKKRCHFEKTQHKKITPIGEKRHPLNNGKPGDIPQYLATEVNEFNQAALNRYIN